METPTVEHLIEYEFIFLGGFVRSHVLKEGEDLINETPELFQIVYPSKNGVVNIPRAHLIQWSVSHRTVTRQGETAVEKVVREIREKDALRQGATVKAAPAPPGQSQESSADPSVQP